METQIKSLWKHLDKEPSPVAVREKWEGLKGMDMVAAKIMLEGLWLDFTSPPELLLECPSTLVTSPSQSLKLEEFIKPWLETGIVAEGGLGEEGFFSRLFTVP